MLVLSRAIASRVHTSLERSTQELLHCAAQHLLCIQTRVFLIDEVDAGREHAGLTALDQAPCLLHHAAVRKLFVQHRQAITLLDALLDNAWPAREHGLVDFLPVRADT